MPKRDEIGREREIKSFLPNVVPTQPGQENSEKNSTKFKKFKNHFPTLFLAKTGWDRIRKRKKKFYFRIPFKLDSGKKIPKKIVKKLKKLKNLFPTLFLAKTERDRPRKREKNFTPEFRSYSTQTRKFQKNSKKIEKIKKPLSDIIFSQNGMR